MYQFKLIEEALWFGLVSAGLFFLTMLVKFDPETVTDWRAWAIALGGGLIRAFAGGILSSSLVKRNE